MKICRDGRIWGQNNKEAGSHLGISTMRPRGIGRLKKHHWHTSTEFKKGIVSHNKGKKCPHLQRFGKDNPAWKGGISANPKVYLAIRRNAGELTVETIQLIYEDNIKKFGTLTCYLCLKPIKFGKDTLEHKLPISRGGTNEYNNLAIACRSCNSKKHAKTEEEYRKHANLVT